MKFFKSRLQIIGAYAGETSVVKIAILHLNLSRLQARFTHYVSEFIQATFRFQADLIQPLVSCTQNDSILFLASISFKCSYHFYTIYIHDLHRSWKKNQRVKFKVSECPYFQLFGTLEPAKTSSPATSELLWANSRVKLNSESSPQVSSQLRSSTPVSPILGQVQAPYFTWAESNVNEKNPSFSLISIRFGSCEVRRLNRALEFRAELKLLSVADVSTTWSRHLQGEVTSVRTVS